MTLLYAESGPLDLLETGVVVLRETGQRIGRIEALHQEHPSEPSNVHVEALYDQWIDGLWDAAAEARRHYHATRGRI